MDILGGPFRRIRQRQPTLKSRLCIVSQLIVAIISNVLCIAMVHAFSVPSNPSSQSSPQPPFHNPSTPEEFVQNQLFHYQNKNLQQAYDFSSPSNKEATGSFSEFERLIQIPPYDLIVGHERADVLMEVIPDGVPNEEIGILEMSCCLVCIRPGKDARRKYPVWFWWEMSLMKADDGDGNEGNSAPATSNSGSAMKGCKWMVDCIMPDFEDLEFETEALTIEQFGEDDGDNEDEVTIYWDFDA